ncbi:hypothetical protein KM043_000060 [Ampulex compressa]|nr:hypothetical protein KM043_000060 [Ampulex compressa]
MGVELGYAQPARHCDTVTTSWCPCRWDAALPPEPRKVPSQLLGCGLLPPRWSNTRGRVGGNTPVGDPTAAGTSLDHWSDLRSIGYYQLGALQLPALVN